MISRFSCHNPARCARLQARQQAVRARAWRDHERLLLLPYQVIISEHAAERLTERNLRYDDVLAAVECGEPVEWWYNRRFQARAKALGLECARDLLLPYTLSLKGETMAHTPLIVVCRYRHAPPPAFIRILTAYDPSSQQESWAADYTHRLCFCQRDEDRQHSSPAKTARLLQLSTPLVYTLE